MDVNKLLRNINNLSDYITVTHDVRNKFKDPKVQFNMSTVLALKKIRSLEIEYFNKYEENGIAFKIFELMLHLPPSKTWSLLGKEMISLLQYWLDALRKHLINHNMQWWSFLRLLLGFITDIRLKDSTLNNTLVQDLTEGLLDSACHTKLDVIQKLDVVQTLNICCAESSREIRFALKQQFEAYFIKLSVLIASTGDMSLQISMLETLLRWLLPRQDPATRQTAAGTWFPHTLYCKEAVNVFLERNWMNFYKDARDFLNAQNESKNLVTSVLCRSLSVGGRILISGGKRSWLDMNTGTKRLSVTPEPHEVISQRDIIIFQDDNVCDVRLYREGSEIKLSLTILDPAQVSPSSSDGSREVLMTISSRSNMMRVDAALRNMFAAKYQVLLDVENIRPSSPEVRKEVLAKHSISEEDTRFSHPIEVRKRKHSGYIVRLRNDSWKSPSTVSTSSLAQLHDKLASLPRFRFDKEPISVSVAPELSTVTEISEIEERSQNTTSTLKLRTFGACLKRNVKQSHDSTKTSRSEDESAKKSISPVNEEENSVSCLLVATIGSADESVINDTLERLPKTKACTTDNIVDLLAQEALRANEDGNKTSAVIDKKTQDFIENTPYVQNPNGKRVQSKHIGSSTDESNTEVVEDTQVNFVNTRKRKSVKLASNREVEIAKAFDEKVIEDFFSQHFTENRNGDVVISPTLAKKINETSSETSEDFDLCDEPYVDELFNINDIDIIECLNEIVDKVCDDFEKCTVYLNKKIEKPNNEVKTTVPENTSILKEIQNNLVDNVIQHTIKTNSIEGVKSKTTKKIKLKFNNKVMLKSKKQLKTKKNKLELETVSRMSPIIERDSVIEEPKKDSSPGNISNKSPDLDTPLLKRKRKLYSPKDDMSNEKLGLIISETEEDTMHTQNQIQVKTNSSAITPYKELEKERKQFRRIRTRKSKTNDTLLLSPRTKQKNDMFESLKNNIESNEQLKFAQNITDKDLAVYNYTSDSEDEDFKKKEIIKRAIIKNDTEKTKPAKRKKATSRPKQRKVKENDCDEDLKKPIRKRVTRQTVKKTKKIEKHELIDERMRKARVEDLNTSFISNKNPNDADKKEPDPIILKTVEMEMITENNVDEEPKKKAYKRTRRILSLKKDNKNFSDIETDEKERTVSPLPGLIVETVPNRDNANESITANMTQKFREIYQDGPLACSEINTTHNLLSDVEPLNCSPPLNVTEELNIVNSPPKKRVVEKPKPVKVRQNKNITKKLTYREKEDNEIINISDIVKPVSETSIATVGKSPINAHCDVDEEPPNSKLLEEHIQPRSMELEQLNQSMADFFVKLTKEINELPDGSKSGNSDRSWINKNVKKGGSDEKSPLVAVTRLSSEEIERWLPSRRNSTSSSEVTKVSPLIKTKKPSVEKSPILNTPTQDKTLRQSVISPIRLFGDSLSNLKVKSDSIQSEDDYVQRIRKIFSKSKTVAKSTRTDVSSRVLRSAVNKDSSPVSRVSTSTKIVDTHQSKVGYENRNANKDQSSPDVPHNKKIKIEINNNKEYNIPASVSSGSSVNDWLNSQPSKETTNHSFKESIEHVMEKLDTTLVEIHHNTSKKFVSMFVDTQKQLNDMKEERRKLFKKAASDILTEMVKLMDAKFEDLDRRSQEMDEQFMSNFKEQARTLIHEDCKQKRAMVTLLRDDVVAVSQDVKRKKGCV